MLESRSPIPLDVVGCADIFVRAHSWGLERVRDRFTLRSFTDPDAEKLRDFGQRYQVKNLYSDVRSMLAANPDGAVLVCTPTSEHVNPVLEALSAGRDVLCEKPIANTLADADRMLEAAAAASRVFQICFMSRYAPCWLKVRELLESGAIGRVISITMTQYWQSLPRLYTNWRTDAAVSGGGIIADSSAHWVDILRWLCGEIDSVAAAGIPAPDSPRPQIEDSAFAIFRFASGALGLLRNSWRHLRPENEAETVEIYGEKGSILGNLHHPWQNGGVQSVRLVLPDKIEQYTFSDPMQRFANQLIDFADLIDRRGRGSGIDGRRALSLQLAICEAMREKRWVDTK